MGDAERITRVLRGHWHGSYGSCMCPAHNNTRTAALSLSDAADGRLLAYCHAGCDFASIIDALRRLGLLPGRGTYFPPPETDLERIRAAKAAEAIKRERQALACWRETRPIRGTMAEAYMRHRGITCDLPETLRFHPNCWHPSAKRLPAMVALVEGAARLAVHRTYLRPDGSGKADVTPNKAMLGSVAGGSVRLTEAPGLLAVAEGVETALSVASGLLRGPATVWAALSTSGLQTLRLPVRAARLVVATDGDAAGRAAGYALAERAHALGWAVSLLPAPDGHDWNDVLCEKAAGT